MALGTLEVAFLEVKEAKNNPPLGSELQTGVGNYHLAPRVPEGNMEELKKVHTFVRVLDSLWKVEKVEGEGRREM
jgi:hypothetical protein